MARDGDALGPGYDIVLLIGQSETGGGNAIPNLDLARLDAVDNRVWQFASAGPYQSVLSLAVEPLYHHNYADGGMGLSPMNAFARRYLEWVASNRNLLIVPMGHGSTGFEGGNYTWKNAVAGNLATVAVVQTLAALAAAGANARIVGAFWIQGQADSGPTGGANYAANLDALIDYLRAQLSIPDLPFVVGQMLPEWIDNHVDAATTDAAQVDTPRRKYSTAYTSSPRGYNYEQNTPTHMNVAGQRIRGYRWFDAFLRARANTVDSVLAAPGAVTLVQTGTTLSAEWVRPLGHLTGYKVELQHNGGAWVDAGHADLTNTHIFTGLTLGDSYAVRASSLNGASTSTPTVSSTFTMATIPAQVTGLTAPTPTALQIDLTWTAVSGATSYLVEHKLTSSGTWLASQTVTTNAASAAELLNNAQYDFRVSAINAAGTGTPSATLTKTTAPLAAPFDTIMPTPMWGYAVSRRLLATYAGPLIRVLRSSDNAQMDVGHVNGDLDTATMLAWSGAASVYVVKIYSQTGGTDLGQATAGKQPRIVNAGVLDTVNGRPCAVFDGTDDLMFNTAPGLWAQGAAGGVTASGVLRSLGSTTKRIIGETRNGQGNGFAYVLGLGGAGAVFNLAAVANDAGTATIPSNAGSGNLADALHQATLTDDGTTLTHYRDGTSVGNFSYSRTGVYTLDRFVLGGGIRTTEELQAQIVFCELCTWSSVLSSGDRATLRANRQTYYGTP